MGKFLDFVNQVLKENKQEVQEVQQTPVQPVLSMETLLENARKGDLSAAKALHDRYAAGDGVPMDKELAYFWARVCSDMGDYAMDYVVGTYFRDGIGVAKDMQKAWKYFERAARKGVAGAQEAYFAAEALFYVVDFAPSGVTMDSLKQEMASKRNQPEVYFNLCLQLANFEEDNDGKNWLGLCYREGTGTPVNNIASVHWLKQAANKGNPFAFYNLAGMYETGSGVLTDYEEAIRLYRIAEQKGHGWATPRINSLTKINGYSAEILAGVAEGLARIGATNRANDVLYRQYVEMAAIRGNITGWLMTGNCYRQQNGVARDYVEAAYYYKKGIILNQPTNAGREFPLRLYAQMCALGQGMPRNMELANHYYNEARQYAGGFASKYPDITTYMQHMSETKLACSRANQLAGGDYSAPDLEAAIKMLEEDGGNKQSQGELVRIYQNLRDMKKMDHYLRLYLVPRQNTPAEEQNNAKIVHDLILKEYNIRNAKACDALQGYFMEELLRSLYYSGAELLAEKCVELAEQMGVAKIQLVWDGLKIDNNTHQNAQMEPEKPALQDGEGAYWPGFSQIRRLEAEGDYEGIMELGYAYLEDEAEEETDEEWQYRMRLAFNCFKIGMLHGEPDGLMQIGTAFFEGAGLPQNLKLAEAIFERLLRTVPDDEEVKAFVEDKLENIRATKGLESMETSDYAHSVGREYKELANQIEEAHYPEEEWLLYEYYNMSAYKFGHNGRFVNKFKSKYFDKRLDWEQILAMPWEEYIDAVREEAEDAEEDFEEAPTRMESLESDAVKEQSENLDVYFEDMIGMEAVKEQLEKIYHMVSMQLLRDKVLEEKGESVQKRDRGYNFILLGNPGTGKTTVARIIAKILYDINIRKADTFLEVDRADIVAEHIGGTAKRMQDILDRVEGGTLFIDEAYSLYREDDERDFGQEAINTLMKDMEDNRNDYSVILAGYKEPMQNMIKNGNEGLVSRFTYVIEIPDYTEDTLVEIAHAYIDRQKFTVQDNVDEAIRKCIDRDKLDDTFGNARYIRELVNRAIENQASRLKNVSDYDMEDLFILKPEDFWQDAYEEQDVDKYLAQLHGLIGLETVKEEVDSLINHIVVRKEMEKRGLVTEQDFGTLHMAFKGNPGTGKTTVARLLGKLYGAMGVLKRGDVFVECSRGDLVGRYMGHTAENVKKVVESAMGGILFIDEAYALVEGEGDNFGLEAINELVAAMENNRENLMVIFAGYTRELDTFLTSNPGLRSRVPKELYFADYQPDQLYEIALKLLAEQKLVLTDAAGEALRRRLLAESLLPNFGNARGVRNMMEDIRRKQNVRIAGLLKTNAAEVTDEMLLTIEAQDVEK